MLTLLITSFCLIVALLVLTQDIQIFPGMVPALHLKGPRDKSTIPQDIESTFLTTSDDKSIESWWLNSNAKSDLSDYVALVLHGNGGSLEMFYCFQEWFRDIGISSLAFDYRGFGYSTGWPSEKGIYADSEAAWDYLLKKSNASPDRVIVFAYSIGSGPAAYLASRYNPAALVVLAGYTSLPNLVKGFGGVRAWLSPFLWYEFGVKNYVSQLDQTNLILAHGKRDTLISYNHSLEIRDAYKSKDVGLILSEHAGHNDLFDQVKGELGAMLIERLQLLSQ